MEASRSTGNTARGFRANERCSMPPARMLKRRLWLRMHGNRGMQHQSSLDLRSLHRLVAYWESRLYQLWRLLRASIEQNVLEPSLSRLDYLRSVNPPFLRIRAPHSAGSILVIAGGSRFCCSFPSWLIFASSAFSSAPTSKAKPVQYNQTISAIAAPSVP